MHLNNPSQASVFVQDADAQIETSIGAIDASVEAPNAQTEQFITDSVACFGVDSSVEDWSDAERCGEIHGGVVLNLRES